MNILSLSHNDGDGFGCTLVLKVMIHFINNKDKLYIYRNIAIDKTEEVMNKIESEYSVDKIVVTDLPYNDIAMRKYKIANKITYRDHHLTKTIEPDGNKIKIDTSMAACQMMMEDFRDIIDKYNIPKVVCEKLEYIIDKLGNYDTFTFIKEDDDYINQCLDMNYIVSLYKYKFSDIMLDRIINDKPIFSDVELIYIKQQRYVLERSITILKDRCILKQHDGIDVYETYSDDLSNIPIYGYMNNRIIKQLGGNVILKHISVDSKKVTLVTDREDIDISAICKRRGGGGHKKVGGYRDDTLYNAISSIRNIDRKYVEEKKETEDKK